MSRPAAFDDEMLMRAAYDALRADGPAALSLRRIAARLGVSEPALHKRIGSKHALLVRLQRWATETTRALVARLDAARDPLPALRELFRVYGRQAASAKTLAHLTAFSALCLADEKLRAPARERHRLLVEGVAAALRRARHPRAAATARAAVALLSGVPLGWATDPEASYFADASRPAASLDPAPAHPRQRAGSRALPGRPPGVSLEHALLEALDTLLTEDSNA